MLSQIVLVGAASLAASFVVARLNASSMKVGDNTYSLKKYSYIVLAVAIALAVLDICLLVLPSNASVDVKTVIAVLMIMAYLCALGISRCKITFFDEEISINGFLRKKRVRYTDIKKCMYMDNDYLAIHTEKGIIKISDLYPNVEIAQCLRDNKVVIESESSDDDFNIFLDNSARIFVYVLSLGLIGCFSYAAYSISLDEGRINVVFSLIALLFDCMGIILIFSYRRQNIHIEGNHIKYVWFLTKEIDAEDIMFIRHEKDSKDLAIWGIYNKQNKRIAEIYDSYHNSYRFPKWAKQQGIKIVK